MGAEAESFEDRQERAEESKALIAGLQSRRGSSENDDIDKSELIEQLTEDDLVASDQALQNLTTKDIPSANFSDEQSHEFRHYLDVMLERKQAAYPHEGQDVVGDLREWVHDDANAGLRPVSKQDLLIDETFKQGVAARITKGKDGSLLRQALSSIKESVLRRGEQPSSGGGILGKLRR